MEEEGGEAWLLWSVAAHDATAAMSSAARRAGRMAMAELCAGRRGCLCAEEEVTLLKRRSCVEVHAREGRRAIEPRSFPRIGMMPMEAVRAESG